MTQHRQLLAKNFLNLLSEPKNYHAIVEGVGLIETTDCRKIQCFRKL